MKGNESNKQLASGGSMENSQDAEKFFNEPSPRSSQIVNTESLSDIHKAVAQGVGNSEASGAQARPATTTPTGEIPAENLASVATVGGRGLRGRPMTGPVRPAAGPVLRSQSSFTGPLPKTRTPSGPQIPTDSHALGRTPTGGFTPTGSSPSGFGLSNSSTASSSASLLRPTTTSGSSLLAPRTTFAGGNRRTKRIPLFLLGFIAGLVVILGMTAVLLLSGDRDTGGDSLVANADTESAAGRVSVESEAIDEGAEQRNGAGARSKGSLNSAGASKQKEASVRRITVRTRPSGLVIVNADSDKRYGESPVTISVAKDEQAPALVAKYRKEKSDLLEIAGDATDIEFDLTEWISSVNRPRASSAPRRRRGRVRATRVTRTVAAKEPEPEPEKEPAKVERRKPQIDTIENSLPAVAPIGEEEGENPSLDLLE